VDIRISAMQCRQIHIEHGKSQGNGRMDDNRGYHPRRYFLYDIVMLNVGMFLKAASRKYSRFQYDN
jgi:hypothetical protein